MFAALLMQLHTRLMRWAFKQGVCFPDRSSDSMRTQWCLSLLSLQCSSFHRVPMQLLQTAQAPLMLEGQGLA